MKMILAAVAAVAVCGTAAAQCPNGACPTGARAVTSVVTQAAPAQKAVPAPKPAPAPMPQAAPTPKPAQAPKAACAPATTARGGVFANQPVRRVVRGVVAVPFKIVGRVAAAARGFAGGLAGCGG